jgi:hypothetical protein
LVGCSTTVRAADELDLGIGVCGQVWPQQVGEANRVTGLVEGRYALVITSEDAMPASGEDQRYWEAAAVAELRGRHQPTQTRVLNVGLTGAVGVTSGAVQAFEQRFCLVSVDIRTYDLHLCLSTVAWRGARRAASGRWNGLPADLSRVPVVVS